MKHLRRETVLAITLFSILLVSFSVNFVSAQSVPEWVKNTALWYGEGIVSETEFLNMIKFLIESGIITLESEDDVISEVMDAMVIIPHRNSDIENVGFYMPLNLEIPVDTTVTWINEDLVPHNIQSQDKFGKISDVFNSPTLNSGDRFEFTFKEDGVYNYYCTFHPWRVGSITVK